MIALTFTSVSSRVNLPASILERSVSYTHLDVYKRQPLNTIQFSGSTSMKTIQTLAFVALAGTASLAHAATWRDSFLGYRYGTQLH